MSSKPNPRGAKPAKLKPARRAGLEARPNPNTDCASLTLAMHDGDGGRAVSQLAFLGRRLVEVYGPAIGGMRYILIFGCLLDLFEAEATREAAALPEPKRNGAGRPRQPTDLKTILELHAPEVNYDAAKRMRRVCRAVGVRYESVVGKQIAKQFGMAQLVTADPATLPEPARLKQMELFEFASLRSSRSWLDDHLKDNEPQQHRGPKCVACGAKMRAHRTAHCPKCGHATGRTEQSAEERFANDKKTKRREIEEAFARLWSAITPGEYHCQAWMLFTATELAGSLEIARGWVDAVEKWQAAKPDAKKAALAKAFGWAAYLPGEGAFGAEAASFYALATRREAERAAALGAG